jgi:RNA polymerase sigma-70 factor (ECF subfamily)
MQRFARILTRSATEADDLVQKTCERAISRADQWRGDTRLESWLFRIMRGIWIDEVRARAARGRQLASLSLEQEDEVMDGGRLAETRLQLQAVMAELQQMPEMDRTLLLMVCVDGLTYREAADMLGVPIGTVMSRLSRARAELGTRLEGRTKSRRPAAVKQAAAEVRRTERRIAVPLPA